MAKARYSSPSELQKRQLATILSRQDGTSDQGPEPTQHIGTKNTSIDFGDVNPQQKSLLCRVPPEIRSYIYLILWREAGLTQHVNPSDDWHDKPFHYRCTPEQVPEPNDKTSETGSGAGTATQPDSEEREQLEKGCYYCRYKFDYGFWEVTGPPPSLEKSAFLPMLLTCKTM